MLLQSIKSNLKIKHGFTGRDISMWKLLWYHFHTAPYHRIKEYSIDSIWRRPNVVTRRIARVAPNLTMFVFVCYSKLTTIPALIKHPILYFTYKSFREPYCYKPCYWLISYKHKEKPNVEDFILGE